MKIVIIGSGYVGLVTGYRCRPWGTMICVDNDKNKLAMVNRGQSPFTKKEWASF